MKDSIVVELVQNARDPHWTSPAIQREFEQFFLTLTQGTTYHEGVSPRILRINNKKAIIMGEFHIKIHKFLSLEIDAAISGWLSHKGERKIRIEFQEVEVGCKSLSEFQTFLCKILKKLTTK